MSDDQHQSVSKFNSKHVRFLVGGLATAVVFGGVYYYWISEPDEQDEEEVEQEQETDIQEVSVGTK